MDSCPYMHFLKNFAGGLWRTIRFYYATKNVIQRQSHVMLFWSDLSAKKWTLAEYLSVWNKIFEIFNVRDVYFNIAFCANIVSSGLWKMIIYNNVKLNGLFPTLKYIWCRWQFCITSSVFCIYISDRFKNMITCWGWSQATWMLSLEGKCLVHRTLTTPIITHSYWCMVLKWDWVSWGSKIGRVPTKWILSNASSLVK